MRPAWIEIDTGAIAHNVREAAGLVGPGVRVLAVVKADGYGHGLVPSARAAIEGGASALGVAILEEALLLREAGIQAPVLVMGCGLPEHAPDLVRHRVAQVVSDLEMAKALSAEAVRQGRPAAVHVKIDTGMGRVGCSPEDAPALIGRVAGLPGLELGGVATHFARSEPDGIASLRRQLGRFRAALEGVDLPPGAVRHAASSAATLLLPEARLDMVRLGLLTYGIPPVEGTVPVDLRPALALKARITQVREVPAGCAVSYGETAVTARPSRLAILPVGYADGYPRRLSGRGTALVNGRPCPILGRICMDQCVADVTDGGAVSVGDEAILLGRDRRAGITVWDLTRAIDGTPHEIVACLGPRLPRVYARGDPRGVP